MELQQHRFGYSGNDMNFAVYSDDRCRIKYVESIAVPMGHIRVELYGIEPGTRTKWVVVRQLDGHKTTLKVFLRQNEKFLENEIDDLPPETRSQIMQRFPNLAAEASPRWSVRQWTKRPAGGNNTWSGVQKSTPEGPSRSDQGNLIAVDRK